MQAYLGREYVQGSICEKMPALMKKDTEKLLEDNAALKIVATRFTKQEQEARAARDKAPGKDESSPASQGAGGAAQSPGQASHVSQLSRCSSERLSAFHRWCRIHANPKFPTLHRPCSLCMIDI